MAKPGVEQLIESSPGLSEVVARQHLERLGERYYEAFDTATAARHAAALAELSRERPVDVWTESADDGRVSVTVLALDWPGIFSVICGVLTGLGFNIESGDVFTYSEAKPRRGLSSGRPRSGFGNRRRLTGRARHTTASPQTVGRRIIDHFVGRVRDTADTETWGERLKESLADLVTRATSRDAKRVAETRKRVNEMVTHRLAEMPSAGDAVLLPVEIEVVEDAGPFTRLRVVSQDTPAFLYALSTALSLRNLVIDHVRIRTSEDRIEDEIDLVDQRGEPVRDPATLDKVRLTVLLTKQFTYFLSKAPDPFAALERFEKLTEQIVNQPDSDRWVEQLANPRTMQDLARLFGTSDYLWEDFVRLQYEALLPMLRPHVEGRRLATPIDRAAEDLEAELASVETSREKRRVLNRFKDQQVFQIDLDHILTPGSDFRQMAERLTALAELVVGKAAELVYADMVETYGVPRGGDDRPVPYAIFGLGKLGGAALGYASDIELLMVYAGDGKSDGKRSVPCAEFFGRMMEEISKYIEAKREGIFRVDLRLRPFGNDGPLASSLEQFGQYYGPEGRAHAVERLSLVRMRHIAGDADLGRTVERMRDDSLYERPEALNLDDLREVRRKAYAEKASGPTFNAKHGCGGLGDLEYSVQTLQVLHGKAYPALRTPRIHVALRGLAEIGGLDAAEAASVGEAYDFLRRLINGLRMLRGNALDLFLPDDESEEYLHLARRMGYSRGSDLSARDRLRLDLALATATVRAFVLRRIGPDALPTDKLANAADLVLCENPAPQTIEHVLADMGIDDPTAGRTQIERFVEAAGRNDTAARALLMAGRLLRDCDRPEMTLGRWVDLMDHASSAGSHLVAVSARPDLLRVLLGVLDRGETTARLFIDVPELIEWIGEPSRLIDADHVQIIDAAIAAHDRT